MIHEDTRSGFVRAIWCGFVDRSGVIRKNTRNKTQDTTLPGQQLSVMPVAVLTSASILEESRKGASHEQSGQNVLRDSRSGARQSAAVHPRLWRQLVLVAEFRGRRLAPDGQLQGHHDRPEGLRKIAESLRPGLLDSGPRGPDL